MPSMDDVRRLEAKGLARAKIRSKRRRVHTIRRRTVRGSLALFAISWGIVFGQLVTGNDPALSRSSHGARKLLASTHRARHPAASTPAPDPTPVTVAPDPAPVTITPPPPPPAPVVTSAS
jgi:hypothetical protein